MFPNPNGVYLLPDPEPNYHWKLLNTWKHCVHWVKNSWPYTNTNPGLPLKGPVRDPFDQHKLLYVQTLSLLYSSDFPRVFRQKTPHKTARTVLQGRLSLSIDVTPNIQIIGKQRADTELPKPCTATSCKITPSRAKYHDFRDFCHERWLLCDTYPNPSTPKANRRGVVELTTVTIELAGRNSDGLRISLEEEHISN